MATRSLRFRASAIWVLQRAKEQVERGTKASVAINRSGEAGGNSGTIEITAIEGSEVEKAVALLQNDSICQDHFFNE